MLNKLLKFAILPALLVAGFFVAGNCAKAVDINNDTVWARAQSPIIITSDIWLKPGVKLTIEPGVVVKFNINRLFASSGILEAVGTKDEPII